MAAWAKRVAGPVTRQLAETAVLARHLTGAGVIFPPRDAIEEAEPLGFDRAAGLAQSLTGASTGVMSRPGQLAQRFGHRRALQRIDDWAPLAGGLAGIEPPGHRGASQGNCRKIFEGERARHSVRAYACWVRRRSDDGRKAGTTEADQGAFSEEGRRRPGAVIEVPLCPEYSVATEYTPRNR